MSREDNLKKFEKGHKPLPPNPEKMKAKKKLKVLLTEFSEDYFEEFKEEFSKLKGKPKCEIYLKVLEYVQPRISSIAFEDIKEASTAVKLLKDFAKYRQQEADEE